MSDCCCEVQIEIPTWVPGAIALCVSVGVAIAVCIAYILREMERHKTFYGREDKLSTREQPVEAKKKEEMDAYAIGRCSDEVLVIKSPHQKSAAGAPPGTVRSGVKVMLRKKRIIMKTPIRPPATSIPTSLEQISPNAVNITVTYDKTGRAFELVDVIGHESPILGSRYKRAETLAMLIKNRLETMTGHNYIVYLSMEDLKWTVKGLENLKDNVDEMHLQMRLNVDAMKWKIMAFKMQTCSVDNAMMLSTKVEGTPDILGPEPTQMTPANRRLARRGSTPDATPHQTPVPESRKRSAELIEQDRREKELMLYGAATLRQGVLPGPTSDVGQPFSAVSKPPASITDNVLAITGVGDRGKLATLEMGF